MEEVGKDEEEERERFPSRNTVVVGDSNRRLGSFRLKRGRADVELHLLQEG